MYIKNSFKVIANCIYLCKTHQLLGTAAHSYRSFQYTNITVTFITGLPIYDRTALCLISSRSMQDLISCSILCFSFQIFSLFSITNIINI